MEDNEILQKLLERVDALTEIVTALTQRKRKPKRRPRPRAAFEIPIPANEKKLMADFLADRCEIGGTLKVPRELLFAAYRCYVNRPHFREKTIRQLLKMQGFDRPRPAYYKPWGRVVRVVRGLHLKALA